MRLPTPDSLEKKSFNHQMPQPKARALDAEIKIK
jgi:hypothetical protein